MPVRRPSWQEQLRQTRAKERLLAAEPDRFPLAELQEISNWFLKSKSPVIRRGAGIAPRSEECDILFANELVSVKNEFPTHETAIIACLHLLSYDQARGQILSVKPDPDTSPSDNLFLDHRLPVYLQCIILSRHASPGVCTDDELVAAEELLGVVRGKAKDFPSMLRQLQAVGQETVESLLPLKLVKKCLRRSHYRENLLHEFETLRKQRKWFDAHKLVCGLRNLMVLPRVDQLLREVFPEYPMWVAWRPDARRIAAWEGSTIAPYRHQIRHVLDLEGPDTTGQQRGTLRRSSPHVFTAFVRMSNWPVLDRLLDDLDTCLGIGPATVDLLYALCIEQSGGYRHFSPRAMDQLEAALELRRDDASKTLANLTRSIANHNSNNNSINDRVVAFTAALPLLTAHPRLQKPFGEMYDLARRAPTTLSSAQRQFCHLLAENRASERLALNVLALGRALLRAAWLHDRWQPAYISMLRNMPSEHEIRSTFRSLSDSASSSHRLGLMDFLATRLGGTVLRTGSTASVTVPVQVEAEDPIWYARMDIDRENLRRMLRSMSKGTPASVIDMSVTTACVKQSFAEPDNFVRELTGIMIDDTDQVCVNLARFLGPRSITGVGRVHESWRTLLLHMMRRRPPGMLERCAEQLSLQSWQSWLDNMRRIFTDNRHMGADGRLGFTTDKFRDYTQRKMGVGRSLSTSTWSTASTGTP
ncbi:hypothetical protein QBC46DRAFT_420796 [Diplogelasinospora grovesii]|uniref:Uncharacterized protein n=1 Tax=Diplogelasinospora grovesii TaxID=303347 RepID=A0AAN6NCP1_9PEZI|nr:hypothetical protein QBC46DRAFT_420796 [Diplogelasinospora grovesii]